MRAFGVFVACMLVVILFFVFLIGLSHGIDVGRIDVASGDVYCTRHDNNRDVEWRCHRVRGERE